MAHKLISLVYVWNVRTFDSGLISDNIKRRLCTLQNVTRPAESTTEAHLFCSGRFGSRPTPAVRETPCRVTCSYVVPFDAARRAPSVWRRRLGPPRDFPFAASRAEVMHRTRRPDRWRRRARGCGGGPCRAEEPCCRWCVRSTVILKVALPPPTPRLPANATVLPVTRTRIIIVAVVRAVWRCPRVPTVQRTRASAAGRDDSPAPSSGSTVTPQPAAWLILSSAAVSCLPTVVARRRWKTAAVGGRISDRATRLEIIAAPRIGRPPNAPRNQTCLMFRTRPQKSYRSIIVLHGTRVRSGSVKHCRSTFSSITVVILLCYHVRIVRKIRVPVL